MFGYTGHRFEKIPKNRNLLKMNESKIIVKDADDSSADELIVQIKKWRSIGLSQYPPGQSSLAGGTTQRDSWADCPEDDRSGIIRAKADDEMIEEMRCENEARLYALAD